MIKYYLTVYLLIIMVISYNTVLNCSCMEQSKIEDEYKLTDEIYTAKIISTKNEEAKQNLIHSVNITNVYKGDSKIGEIKNINNCANGACCGVGIKDGEEYLLYVHNYKDSEKGDFKSSINSCDRTKNVKYAADELPELLELYQSSSGSTSGYFSKLSVIGIIIISIILILF